MGFMLEDQGFSKGVFDEKVRYCRAQHISDNDLFVPYDGGPLIEDTSQWTNKYYASQQTKFRANFSRERLAHLKKVGAHLFPRVEAQKKNAERISDSSTREARSRRGGTKIVCIAGGIAAAAFILWLILRK
jgi:hypothetical protein